MNTPSATTLSGSPLVPTAGAYRGRIAPSPTGYLHLGHARTFWTAQQRAQAAGGTLILRNEDLDAQRARPEFVAAMLEDLRWFGFDWQEGPDLGGPCAPYEQSKRHDHYVRTLLNLAAAGCIYPCTCSRKEIQQSVSAPHATDEEPIYPGNCRHALASMTTADLVAQVHVAFRSRPQSAGDRRPTNWRFRVPDGEHICFEDVCFGPQQFMAGRDFGDFIVWRHDQVPAYQLAVVTDDADMRITEVVRGADLLVSTARQLLLYRALGLKPPTFYHCPLVTDERGVRLAKRHAALSLRALREQGASPDGLRANWRLPSR